MSAIDELHDRYAQAMLGRKNDERLMARELEEEAASTVWTSPAGRRALRGIPAIGGTGGLDVRQDPLRYLIDCERDPRLRVDV